MKKTLLQLVEVSREAVLPLFNEMFSAISCVVADPDQNVKNGSELLDRLLKDIVTESKAFDVESFVPALRERMYTRDRWAVPGLTELIFKPYQEPFLIVL